MITEKNFCVFQMDKKQSHCFNPVYLLIKQIKVQTGGTIRANGEIIK